MKKAFTLIELLVVITVILILASLLFPVFMRAKIAGKQAVDIVHSKELAAAYTLYASDNDDTFPLAYPGNYGTRLYTTPWQENQFPDQFAYTNSLSPYVKSLDIWKSAGTTSEWQANIARPDFHLSHFMNSYMNSWNIGAVDSPSQAIIDWPAQGSISTMGVGFAMPLIYTLSHIWLAPGQFPGDIYRFQNNGPDCVQYYGYYSVGDFRIFGNGIVLGYVDGHSKWLHVGAPGNPITDLRENGGLLNYPTNPVDAANSCWYDWPLSPHYPN